jgi:PST family polysaccharide transporter
VQLALQLGLALLLQRILTAEDVGVQAYIFPVALLVQGIANAGLQGAIIQHQGLSQVEASAVFWASLRWNALLVAAMVPLAALLAMVNGDTRVIPVAAVWALIIYGATCSAIPEALLKQQFRFGVVLGAHLSALLVSIVVAVLAARAGAGYWTYLIQMAVVEFGRVGIIWRVSGWRPLAPAALGDATRGVVRELRTYWRGVAGSRFVGWMGEQCDRLAVGALLGIVPLGFYDTGKRWGTFAFLEPFFALTEVAVATLSRVRDDPARFTQYARNAFLPVLATSLPVAGFLFAEPAGVLHVLFGERWVASAPTLRWIALAAAIGSIGRLAQWVSLASGVAGPARQLRWTLVTTPIFLACVFIGVRSGMEGVAIGVVVASVLTSLPGVFFLLAHTPVRARDVLPVWVVPMLASAAGAMLLRAGNASLPDASAFTGLVVRGLVFLGVYALAWVLMPGGLAMLRAARPRGGETPRG